MKLPTPSLLHVSGLSYRAESGRGPSRPSRIFSFPPVHRFFFLCTTCGVSLQITVNKTSGGPFCGWLHRASSSTIRLMPLPSDGGILLLLSYGDVPAGCFPLNAKQLCTLSMLGALFSFQVDVYLYSPTDHRRKPPFFLLPRFGQKDFFLTLVKKDCSPLWMQSTNSWLGLVAETIAFLQGGNSCFFPIRKGKPDVPYLPPFWEGGSQLPGRSRLLSAGCASKRCRHSLSAMAVSLARVGGRRSGTQFLVHAGSFF